jgi:hydroxymethylbilane synthase
MRRRALVVEARPDLDVVEFRGNLDTRLTKVRDGVVDVAILAAAGIERLYRGEDENHPDVAPLDPFWWVPAPAQGALAIEARADRADVAALFEDLTDPASRAEVACERAFSARLEGGCSVPLGCSAVVSGANLTATGYLATPDAAIALRDRISGSVAEAASLGTELAEALLAAGGDEVLDEIRASEITEPSAP